METGMADYTHKAATTGSIYLETVSEYDLYCHYVAGLVGEGLSRLFAASGKEAAYVGSQLELSNSMGLLLQKTNIIRDFREDVDDKRFFWPREIWGRCEVWVHRDEANDGDRSGHGATRDTGSEWDGSRCAEARDRLAGLPAHAAQPERVQLLRHPRRHGHRNLGAMLHEHANVPTKYQDSQSGGCYGMSPSSMI